MKKSLIFILLTFILISCTKFEIYNEIKPTITIMGRTVGVVYKLGDITVNDEWKKMSNKQIDYLIKNKDNLKISVYVKYNNEGSNYPSFKYYVNGIEFKETQNAISAEMLLANKDSINNFFLYKLEGNKISEMDEEEVKSKIDKIKKELPKENKASESKWSNESKY